MYHGRVVPGFPQHPHRGFETVTVMRSGYVDHSDSLGASARFGTGDVQWLTAGEGIVHSEMFPLIDREQPNPVELFQIWLNLPRADKLVKPHFSMLWSAAIPRITFQDWAGRATEVTVIAGALGEVRPPAAPPHSWASRADTDVAIWCIKMQPGAVWSMPPARHREAERTIYFFRGSSLAIGDDVLRTRSAARVDSHAELRLEAGDTETEILVLQGRPIGEPVVQYGPFVMNSREEIQQAFADYQRTHFGGWPFPADDPVHGRDVGRFAKHADGRFERA
jgi:redox-sensitive bicupin YhaK (pirin superfamily)